MFAALRWAASGGSTGHNHATNFPGVHEERSQYDNQSADTKTDSNRPLALERFDLKRFSLIDTHQHDDEKKQNHDRSGIDNDLHGGQELRIHREEKHGNSEQCEHHRERAVHRVLAHDDANGTEENHGCSDNEDNGFDRDDVAHQ